MSVDSETDLQRTERTTFRRKKERGSFDRALVNDVLDEALLAHVGFATAHGPVVLPMTYARVDDVLYLHGAAGNDMLRRLAEGIPLCVTVTLLDGLVLARSAFHHSMNYRSVVLFGTAGRVTDRDEMLLAMAALVDHIAEGRSVDARPPTDEELRATLMIRLPIVEGSAKVRTGPPIEETDDLRLPVWGGVVPLALVAGTAEADGAGQPVETPAYAAEHRLRA